MARNWWLLQKHGLICFLMVATWPLFEPDPFAMVFFGNFDSPILMGIHFRSDCLRNYYVLTPFGARFWISYCASYPHVRCTQTTSGRGSKAASASCASCGRSDTWPGRWWHLDKKPVMLGWASWFWTFFFWDETWRTWEAPKYSICLVGKAKCFPSWLPFKAGCHFRLWTKRGMPQNVTFNDGKCWPIRFGGTRKFDGEIHHFSYEHCKSK